ncbi:uncharacterized protein PGTG_12153 [Puccinia graminis f. sp. tritici CRL 75-36-700-3]|uniref:Secreted protein n=1 Tax=Puccinia graminis f. sp. tritici (strain CRL 75-36-700-3 / race SCCL) TaxID=418459 RepID=E3KPG2_PUCGT|nr:uncharacterized protein PGTG_12153 [Puccinia graminis f. sp. tritici CRL 75-36-700-3]EFP86197.2 hypothetical protein PGTG_12153 [Puccinia graminis f. sp. tritici CRL 75-36-700-3]
MKTILVILITLNCSLFGLSKTSASKARGIVQCASYDFSGSSKVCTDKNDTAWKCGTCTGSITAHGCRLSGNEQQDPDSVDCQVSFSLFEASDKNKSRCTDELRHSHICSGGTSSHKSASCTGCQLAKST